MFIQLFFLLSPQNAGIFFVKKRKSIKNIWLRWIIYFLGISNFIRMRFI